jgi:hypothetical protein
MTEGSVLMRRSRHKAADCFYYMSTYRWELLLHVHLPLGMTEGSVLKRRSRQRAADCFTTSRVSPETSSFGISEPNASAMSCKKEGSLGSILRILQEEPTLLHRTVLIRHHYAIASRKTMLSPVLQIRDPGRSGTGISIPDQISESLETIFWVKNT